MHKESKWLVRGGRKVRCYLCGKKILKKDPCMFHENTGYYSHNFCIMEANTIDRNERRRAVKKIAVGAAVVGAMAAGAGKFIDISSQSRGSLNSPDTQTILTSQGLILPSLTSDPANPVAGQMWYRSDAGVTAHFDAVQNRVVYSSEINNGMANVTSKGIINGLSVLPNDGTGWFGPDTTLGATARGQYGSPYTETVGIQEAINAYAAKGYTILLLPGEYTIHSAITYNPTPVSAELLPGISIIGHAPFTTNSAFSGYGVTITPASDFPSSTYIFSFNGLQSSSHLAFVQLENINFINGTNTSVSGTYHYNANAAIYSNLHYQSFSISHAVDGNSNNTTVINVIIDYPEKYGFYNNTDETYYFGCTIYGDSGAGGLVFLDSQSAYATFVGCGFEAASPSPYMVSLNGAYNNAIFDSCHIYNGTFTTIVTVGAGVAPSVYFSNCFIASFDAILDCQDIANVGLNSYFSNTRALGNSGATLYSSGTTSLNIGCYLSWVGGSLENTTFDYPNVLSINSLRVSNFTDVKNVNRKGFSETTPSVPASTSSYTNPEPYTVRIYFLTASGLTYTITDRNATASDSLTGAAGQWVELGPGCAITPTYTTLTWEFYGV